jgi:hypothetical protein
MVLVFYGLVVSVVFVFQGKENARHDLGDRAGVGGMDCMGVVFSQLLWRQ